MRPTDEINASTDFSRLFIEHGKAATNWAAGVEVEVFGFTKDTRERITPAQVQSVIEGFAPEVHASQVEDGFVIEALVNDGKLSVEPGGQIEFSTDTRQSLVDLETSIASYFSRLGEIGERLGVNFLVAGFDPLCRIEEQQWFPKRRYDVMRPYLGKRGVRAWDMMCRTAATQVNLDYSDAADLARKFTLASRLAPVAAAMFANSPFVEGKLSGYKSTRYAAWLETDTDRTGASPCALDGDFSVGRFVDYVKRVPMFFIRRGGNYVDLAGYDFRRFLESGFEGQAPLLQDFTDHLSTIFTEARLKPHIEQRSMDCGRLELVMAATAFWKGLLYDDAALAHGLEIAPPLSVEQYRTLQLEVARHGLEARLGKVSVLDLAREALALARQGLQTVAPDEVKYLDALDELVAREAMCPADVLIQNFRGRWNGDIRQAIEYLKI